MPKEIKGFKGFNKDWTCRDFQYEQNKTFTHDGFVETCQSGFHFCPAPISVLTYYPPATSVYAPVTGLGKVKEDGDKDDFKDKVFTLYDMACITEDEPVANSKDFCKRIERLLG